MISAGSGVRKSALVPPPPPTTTVAPLLPRRGPYPLVEGYDHILGLLQAKGGRYGALESAQCRTLAIRQLQALQARRGAVLHSHLHCWNGGRAAGLAHLFALLSLLTVLSQMRQLQTRLCGSPTTPQVPSVKCSPAGVTMQALRTAFLGTTFQTKTVAARPQQSSNATRQVTCMAKKKVGSACIVQPASWAAPPGPRRPQGRPQGAQTRRWREWVARGRPARWLPGRRPPPPPLRRMQASSRWRAVVPFPCLLCRACASS